MLKKRRGHGVRDRISFEILLLPMYFSDALLLLLDRKLCSVYGNLTGNRTQA